MKPSSVEVLHQTPPHPPHPPPLTFDVDEAERLTACAERASHDRSNNIETSGLLKSVARILYCALVETTQRAKLRLASVIALDRISNRLRRFDQEADVEDMLATRLHRSRCWRMRATQMIRSNTGVPVLRTCRLRQWRSQIRIRRSLPWLATPQLILNESA